MNYQKIYDDLINRAKDRVLTDTTYTETHHVIPRCLGGPDNLDNLVKLTAEEHYVAHQLLVKLHPKNHKILCAALFMSVDRYGHRVSNKRYGWLRRLHIEYMRSPEMVEKTARRNREIWTGRKHSEESRAKMTASRTGKVLTEEHRANMAKAVTGRIASDEARRNMSKAQKGLKKPPHLGALISARQKGVKLSPERVEKMRIASTGRKHSEETRAKIGNAHRGRKFSEERCKQMSEYLKGIGLGKKMSEESKAKISAAHKGKVVSEETRQKIRDANLGKVWSDDAKQKASDLRRGVPKTEAHNAAVAQSKLGTKRIEVSPGKYKMLKLEHVIEMKQQGLLPHIKIKDYFPNYTSSEIAS